MEKTDDTKKRTYTDYVKENASTFLAVFVLVIVLLAYVTIYYRGFWKIGPFIKNSPTEDSAEIKELIKSINDAF
jgi:hypothetical protein